MQVVSRRQGQCLFCSFRTQLSFSTSATAPRENKNRGQEKNQRAGGSAARSSEFRSNARHAQFRPAEGAVFDRNHRAERPSEERSDARHVRFRPGEGAAFDRNYTFERPSRGGRDESGLEPNRFRPERITNPKILSQYRIQEAGQAIEAVLKSLGKKLLKEEILGRLNLADKELLDRWATFQGKVTHQLHSDEGPEPPLLKRLRLAHVEKSGQGLELELKYAFFGEVVASRFTKANVADQERLANLRYPAEWFPATRGYQREFHLHVGPTNSGKTYQALKRLEEVKTGLYAGPLRLLAYEVYTRLNARGQRCNLVTGDDRRTADDDAEAPMTSCTVEMVPLNARFDVAVIDEIQMIGSEDRGWAWTQAVLGVMAREVHLCGEERTIPIIKELVAACGEKLHIHKYERLSPLKVMPRSLQGRFKDLQKGDCIVCFSVATIHGLRQALEKALKCKVAVIYGSLPPETRAAQAKLFNDPDNDYDILVASDAIGMGLNLSIKRIVFQAAHRRTAGNRMVRLSIANVKQIAGRAGRFKTAQQGLEESTSVREATGSSSKIAPVTPVGSPKSLGFVTTMDGIDHPIIAKAMASEAEPITSAGLFPPAYIVEKFARYFPPGTPFSYLLIRLHELAQTSRRFYLCDLRQQVAIADAIETVQGLTTTEKLTFCSAPIEPRKFGEPDLARAYASAVAENKPKSLLDFEDVESLDLNLLQDEYEPDRQYLKKLEGLHKAIIIFMWLSFRYSGVFVHRELAIHIKELVETRIEDVLSKLSFDYERMRKSREKAVLDMLAKEAEKGEDDASLGDDEQTAIPDVDPRREELMLDSLDEYGETDDSGPEKVVLGTNSVDSDAVVIALLAHEIQGELLSTRDEVQLSLANLQAVNASIGPSPEQLR